MVHYLIDAAVLWALQEHLRQDKELNELALALEGMEVCTLVFERYGTGFNPATSIEETVAHLVIDGTCAYCVTKERFHERRREVLRRWNPARDALQGASLNKEGSLRGRRKKGMQRMEDLPEGEEQQVGVFDDFDSDGYINCVCRHNGNRDLWTFIKRGLRRAKSPLGNPVTSLEELAQHSPDANVRDECERLVEQGKTMESLSLEDDAHLAICTACAAVRKRWAAEERIAA